VQAERGEGNVRPGASFAFTVAARPAGGRVTRCQSTRRLPCCCVSLQYMALFFNKEHEANELFNTIVSTYTRLSEVASAAAASAPAAKTVAWIQWWVL